MSLYRVTCAEMNKGVWVVAVQRQGAGEEGRLSCGTLYYCVQFPEDFSQAERTSVHG